jgi:surface carbohydrate biosynthesis protein
MIKFLFAKPKPVQALILYEDQSELLKKWVLHGISTVVLPVGGWLCLHPWIIVDTLRRLFNFDLQYILGGKILQQFIKFLYQCHLEAYICAISPAVVLTWIDDSGVFHRLSRRNIDANFFAVQNGYRANWAIKDMPPPPPHPGSKISFPNFFCFGPRDESLYKSFGHEIDRYYPVGSLLGGIYWSTIAGNRQILFDICYVSQWERYVSDPALIDYDIDNSFMNKLRLASASGLASLDDMLAGIVSKDGFSLTIALRSNDPEEEQYFRKKYGESVHIAKANRAEFSTYHAMDKARLTINLLSTCGFEALGVGHRVLFCNPRGDSMLVVDRPELCTFTGNDPDALKDRIVQLINMSQNEYSARVSDDAKYLMSYDLINPPHRQIRSALEATFTFAATGK